jgi:putative heme-binding domain-containing protein
VQAAAALQVTMPEALGASALAERLKNASGATATSVPAEFASVDWQQAARGGDAQRGRKLFSADMLGCSKCHAVGPNQKSGGGPSLADAARRFTVAHLVESILLPNKQVAPIFGTTSLVTRDGLSLSGLVVEESPTQIVLLLPTAARQVVPLADVEQRALQPTSPMPTGLVKNPAELGDLLAYLLSPNAAAP